MSSPPAYDNLWQYLRDCAIALVLVLGACLFAGAVTSPLGGATGLAGKLAYGFAFWVGLAPFCWFLRRCHVHQLGWLDYVALGAFGIGIMLLRHALVLPMNVFTMVTMAIGFGCFLAIWGYVRRLLG